MLAPGRECLAAVAFLRAEPAVFELVAFDPTVSRLLDVLAADVPAALKAIDPARAQARARVWALAGPSDRSRTEGPLNGIRC